MEYDGKNGFKFSAREIQLVTICNESIKTAKSLNFEYSIKKNDTPTVMKKLLLLLTIFSIGHLSFGQNNGPNKITPQILQKLKADIEKQVPIFRQKLSTQDFTADRIEFSVDTFRIEQLVSKRMQIDYSTVGMNTTVEEMAISYDKLLNKYYNKLLKLLNTEDKKTLINAQRSWLTYRDAETKLIGTMTKEEYSGGGTIQSTNAVGAYADLIVKRTIEIFKYYDGILKDN